MMFIFIHHAKDYFYSKASNKTIHLYFVLSYIIFAMDRRTFLISSTLLAGGLLSTPKANASDLFSQSMTYDKAFTKDTVRRDKPSIIYKPGSLRPHVLITAPHSTAHYSYHKPVGADKHTGGVAQTLSQITGASLLAMTSPSPDWDHWSKRTDDFSQKLHNHCSHYGSHGAVIDIHGMNDHHGCDIALGSSNHTHARLTQSIVNAFRFLAPQYKVDIDRVFPAKDEHTVTWLAQSKNTPAIQIEFSHRLRTTPALNQALKAIQAGISYYSATEHIPRLSSS